MTTTRRRRQRGFGMVEFAIVIPVVLLVVFGMIDFGRAIQINSTVAEAARQGARQMAANAAQGDNPFASSPAGTCSGIVFTQNATGTGCLTDQAILTTVKAVLKDVTTSVTLQSVSAAGCSTPAAGTAQVCISPGQSGITGSYPDCATAKSTLGHDPSPGDLGTRTEEWTQPQYKQGRCFLVQVTVKFAFQPWTPLITKVIGSSITMTSSTSTVAEY